MLHYRKYRKFAKPAALFICALFITSILIVFSLSAVQAETEGQVRYDRQTTATPIPTPEPTATPIPTPDNGMYRGVQCGPYEHPFGTSDVQTIQNNGGSIIEFAGWSYSAFLPNAITSPNQVSSNAFTQMDTYASWAKTYGIKVIFTFTTLSGSGTPTWMLNLAGGSASQLEYDLFMGNSRVNSAKTSITCLWQAFATRYANNPYVCFDLFNEPFAHNSLINSGNYRAIETGYANIMTNFIDAIRTINPNQIILVDAPWSVYYDYWYGGGITPVDIPRDIIWEFHLYINNIDLTYSVWSGLINWATQKYVTVLGKPLFIGEYGYDVNGIEGPNPSNWQNILSSQVTLLKNLPLWGYQWWAYANLSEKSNNILWSSQGYAVYSASDSTWILNTVLHP